MNTPPLSIFKANDIRGIYGKTLTEDGARQIGLALAQAVMKNGGIIAIARDGRLSSPSLAKSLAEGLCQGGAQVLDIGLAPTPALYYAAYENANGCGAMITGSHNPPTHNGIKMLIGGKTIGGKIARQLLDGATERTAAVTKTMNIQENYICAVCAAAPTPAPLHLVIDAGNGATSVIAPLLYRQLGHTVTPLFCEIDGTFPNHHPDPAQPENLIAARQTMKDTNADMAFIFDGDGDRLGVLLNNDEDWIFPDRLLMLLAQDLLARQKGARIVFDVKCSSLLAPWITQHGGIADMQPTGHSFIKAQMKKTGALLGGEMSGHFYFAENWRGFDDALLAGAKLAAIFAADKNAARDIPRAFASPEIVIDIGERDGHALIVELKQKAVFADSCRIITIDGLRVEYAGGFGLARASNTTTSLILRFEGGSEKQLQAIKDDFCRALALVNIAL